MKKQSRLDVRKYSFSQRTINVWNKLSTDCVHASSVNSYEPTRHYSGATELNTDGRRAEILARWTVFTKAAIEHRRMDLALCNIGFMFTTSGT